MAVRMRLRWGCMHTVCASAAHAASACNGKYWPRTSCASCAAALLWRSCMERDSSASLIPVLPTARPPYTPPQPSRASCAVSPFRVVRGRAYTVFLLLLTGCRWFLPGHAVAALVE